MAVLLLGGLMFATSAQAQSGTLQNVTSSTDVKTLGTWHSTPEALQLLETQIQGPIEQSLASLQPGQQYTFWKSKAQLYEAVRTSILNGVSAPKAIRANFDHLSGNVDSVISPLSQSDWQVIYNELVDLLTF